MFFLGVDDRVGIWGRMRRVGGSVSAILDLVGVAEEVECQLVSSVFEDNQSINQSVRLNVEDAIVLN